MVNLASVSGVIVYYRPANSDTGERIDAAQSIKSVSADSVFFRDGNKMYYMSTDNQTRLSEWEELVDHGNEVALLNFMLAEHDDYLEE